MSVIRLPKRNKTSCQECNHVRNKPSGEFCQKSFLYTAELKIKICPMFQANQIAIRKEAKQHKKEMKLLKDVCRNWLDNKCCHYNISIRKNHQRCPNFRDKGERGEI